MKKNLIFLLVVLLAVGGYFYYKKKKKNKSQTNKSNRHHLAIREDKTPLPVKSPKTYTVKKGDTMFLIAKKLGVSLRELVKANPQIKNPDVIYVKQKIFIP